MAGRRVARFRVQARLDGAASGTVEIEYHGAALAFFRVRPLRRRKVFELSLADVARGVVYDVTRREVAERKRQRKAARK